MHWQEFQDTADRLAQAATEGDWRSAISRAYYAVFHYFRDLFLSQGLDLGRSGQAHFNLYVGLLNCGLVPVAPFGSQVDDLREARVAADYDLRLSVLQPEAIWQTQKARHLVRAFQALLAAVPSAQIVNGVRQYLRSIGRIP